MTGPNGTHVVDPETERRFWSKVQVGAADECWPWTAAVSSVGYGQFRVGGVQFGAHRVSFILANGRRPEDLIMHTCDTPACVNPAHLREGTPADNSADMVAKGRSDNRQGERNTAARLTDADVKRIRRCGAAGETQASIGRGFGVSRRTVGFILAGERWSHVG